MGSENQNILSFLEAITAQVISLLSKYSISLNFVKQKSFVLSKFSNILYESDNTARISNTFYCFKLKISSLPV